MTTLYKILQVRKNASIASIKAAYKKLASKYHPDKKTGNKKKFQEIEHAYRILKDKEKRKRYDETGEDGTGPQEASPEVQSMGLICSLYLQVAEANMFQPKDYFKDVQAGIQNSLRQCLADGKKNAVQMAALKELIKNTKGSEMLTVTLDAKMAALAAIDKNAKEGEIILGLALETLTTFKYTGKVPDTFKSGTMPWEGVNMSRDPYI